MADDFGFIAKAIKSNEILLHNYFTDLLCCLNMTIIQISRTTYFQHLVSFQKIN